MSNRLKSTLVACAVAFAMLALVSVPAQAGDKPSLSKSELKDLIAHAATKADHERIAQYFDAEAVRYDADAKEHGELSEYYHKVPDPTLSKHPSSQRSFAHCDSLSKSLQKAAETARQLAADHRGMGTQARGAARFRHFAFSEWRGHSDHG